MPAHAPNHRAAQSFINPPTNRPAAKRRPSRSLAEPRTDFLFAEWNNKAAGFVGYGSAGGVRAVEHLRLVMAEVQVATVRAQVMLSLREDFENYSVFKPRDFHAKVLGQMLDQVIAWSGALKNLRETAA